MIGPLDEFPLHQAPAPIARPATSDRNFYDRSYFNAHGRDDDLFLVTGIGYYPNLGVKDAFVVVRRGVDQRDEQTAVHLSDAIDGDRIHQHVNGFRVEVPEPLTTLRLVLEETEGIALDLTWRSRFPPLAEERHVMYAGHQTLLDAQRFAQVGTWEGSISIDGQDVAVTPDRWVGTRDRSWGIRPVGEAVPAGRPADPPFDGMWWLYLPFAFEDFWIVIILQEEPDGRRVLQHCVRTWADGRTEELRQPRVEIGYRSGTRTPTHARVDALGPDGRPVVLEVEALLSLPITVGAGYGGDPDWQHGTWHGPAWCERRTYDLADPGVSGRTIFGLVDSSARAVCDGAEGWGSSSTGSSGGTSAPDSRTGSRSHPEDRGWWGSCGRGLDGSDGY